MSHRYWKQDTDARLDYETDDEDDDSNPQFTSGRVADVITLPCGWAFNTARFIAGVALVAVVLVALAFVFSGGSDTRVVYVTPAPEPAVVNTPAPTPAALPWTM